MKVNLPSGAEFTVRPLDEGRISLAGLLALTTGQAQTIHLSSGETIADVRIAEIEHLAMQIVAPAA
ncbi:hypothetical protein [Hyphomonas sp.]|uniref:hypothetical protein n=1 Tax=Hyphomonas sp. TaxID=87 RepID=UPI0032EB8829